MDGGKGGSIYAEDTGKLKNAKSKMVKQFKKLFGKPKEEEFDDQGLDVNDLSRMDDSISEPPLTDEEEREQVNNAMDEAEKYWDERLGGDDSFDEDDAPELTKKPVFEREDSEEDIRKRAERKERQTQTGVSDVTLEGISEMFEEADKVSEAVAEKEAVEASNAAALKRIKTQINTNKKMKELASQPKKEIEELKKSGAVAKAKIDLQLVSNTTKRKVLTESITGLNAKKLILRRQLLELKKAKQPFMEIEEDIKLIDEEIALCEDELKVLVIEAESLNEKMQALNEAFGEKPASKTKTKTTSVKEVVEKAEEDEDNDAPDEDGEEYTTEDPKEDEGNGDGDDSGEEDEELAEYEMPEDVLEQMKRKKFKFDELEPKEQKTFKKVFSTLEEEDHELGKEFMELKIIRRLTQDDFEKILEIDPYADEKKEGSLERVIGKMYRKTKLQYDDIKEIYNRIDPDIQPIIEEWKPEVWSPFEFSDFVKMFNKLKRENSVLLKQDNYWQTATVKKLILLIHSATKESKGSDEDGGDLMREEQLAYHKRQRENTMNIWKGRAAQQTSGDATLYKKLKGLLSVDKDKHFFGKVKDNVDPLDNILKIAKEINTFNVKSLNVFNMDSNPFAEFENNVKNNVVRKSNSIKSSRKTYLDALGKITAAKKDDPKLENAKNYEVRQMHDRWLELIRKKDPNITEITEKDGEKVIDDVLVRYKADYISGVESSVEKMLNGIWSKRYVLKSVKGADGKKTQELEEKDEKLDPKDKAVIKYFGEFLEKSNEEMEPLIEHKIDEYESYKVEKLKTQKKYADEDESRSNKKDKKKESLAASYRNKWINARGEAATLIRVLVKSYLSYGGKNKKYATNYGLDSKEQPNYDAFEKVRTKLIEDIKRYERNLKISGRVTKAGAEKYDKHLENFGKELAEAKASMKRLKIKDSVVKRELTKYKKHKKEEKADKYKKGLHTFEQGQDKKAKKQKL